MSLFNCKIKSMIMGKDATKFNVILPNNVDSDTPWILLLHGLTGDETDWERFSSVEFYVRDLNYAVVMPYGADSFYADEVYGNKYYSYITQELIPYVQKVFPLSKKREKMFIAGLSMGGYGALKIGLRNPEMFGAIAAFSSPADIYERFKNPKDTIHDFVKHGTRIWGPDFVEKLKPCKGNKENLFCLVEDFDYKKPVPWVYMACGTEDPLYNSNVKLHELIEKYPIHHEWHCKPGIHNWDIWDYYFKDSLRFFTELGSVSD